MAAQRLYAIREISEISKISKGRRVQQEQAWTSHGHRKDKARRTGMDATWVVVADSSRARFFVLGQQN